MLAAQNDSREIIKSFFLFKFALDFLILQMLLILPFVSSLKIAFRKFFCWFSTKKLLSVEYECINLDFCSCQIILNLLTVSSQD